MKPMIIESAGKLDKLLPVLGNGSKFGQCRNTPVPNAESRCAAFIKGNSGFYWGCSGHPDCSVTLPDIGGNSGRKKPQTVSNFAGKKRGKHWCIAESGAKEVMTLGLLRLRGRL